MPRPIDAIENDLTAATAMLVSYYRDEIEWQQDHVDILKRTLPTLRAEMREAIDRRDAEYLTRRNA